jgi:transcriptional regulator with XRE-family HTH domain
MYVSSRHLAASTTVGGGLGCSSWSSISQASTLQRTDVQKGGQVAVLKKKKPNPIDRHVGARVRMRRLMLDMTQTQLGDKLGLTFQQVQKYEKGTNRIGASRLQHIAEVLQVPVSFFFEGVVGEMKSAESRSLFVSDFLASSEGIALVKAYMSIKDTKTRRCIVQLVEQISPRAS